jgi:hypothetical protein
MSGTESGLRSFPIFDTLNPEAPIGGYGGLSAATGGGGESYRSSKNRIRWVYWFTYTEIPLGRYDF